MAWLEVSVRVIPEAAEAVSEVLSRYAPEGVVIVPDADDFETNPPVIVKAYLQVDEEIEERRRKVEQGLWYLHQIWSVIPEPTYTIIEDQDWTAGWKESIPVLHIGRRVVIKPSWREYAGLGDEIILELDPGLAFGSGLHPTTQLCIEAVEEIMCPGWRVLDIGTGTGILALVATKLGAGLVLAVDTDENAITAARRNIHHNHTRDVIHLRLGSLAGVEGEFDLVLANILAPIIISMVEAGLQARLSPEGFFIASGILNEQVNEVEAVMRRSGLEVMAKRHIEDWAVLISRRV